MKETSYKILQYLQKHGGKATAMDISKDLNIAKRLVDSYFSAAIVHGGLGVRDDTKTPAILMLNKDGMTYTQ